MVVLRAAILITDNNNNSSNSNNNKHPVIPYEGGSAISLTTSSPILNLGKVTCMYVFPSFVCFRSLLRFSLKCRLAKTCLQNVPSHEKHVILGCHWFKVEWNPSKQLVSAFGESLLISFSMLAFMRISCILSYTFVPFCYAPLVKEVSHCRMTFSDPFGYSPVTVGNKNFDCQPCNRL